MWDAALGEVERVQALNRGEDMLHLASLVGFATLKPQELNAESERLKAARRLPRVVSPTEVVDRTTDILERVALAGRIARRKAARGEAVAPLFGASRGH